MVDCEDTIAGKDIEEGMFGKEGGGEITEVGELFVLGIGPPGGELEGVGLYFTTELFGLVGLVLFGKTGGIGIVLGVGTIGDNEYLHIVEEGASHPEGLALVAVDLVEGLFDIDPTSFEFDMNEWQPIDEDGDVVAETVLTCTSVGFVGFHLVDHLEAVVMDIAFVEQVYVACFAIVAMEQADIVALNDQGLIFDC